MRRMRWSRYAVGETSATKVRSDAEWEERGDAMNLDIQVEWRAMPMDEVSRRLREVPGELRGYLTVVPEKEAPAFQDAFRRIVESIRLTEVR